MNSKLDLSQKVHNCLSDEKNEKIMQQIMAKMSRLMQKKQCLQNQRPNMVYDNRIWVGNYSFANNKQFLKAENINIVISCLQLQLNLQLPHVEYKRFSFKDNKDDRFQSILFDFIQFIQLNQGNILVHWYELQYISFSGKSRSVSLLLGLFIYKNNWNYDQAMQFLKASHPIANPNSYFQSVLRSLQNKLRSYKPQLNEDLLGNIEISPKKQAIKISSSKQINLMDVQDAKIQNQIQQKLLQIEVSNKNSIQELKSQDLINIQEISKEKHIDQIDLLSIHNNKIQMPEEINLVQPQDSQKIKIVENQDLLSFHPHQFQIKSHRIQLSSQTNQLPKTEQMREKKEEIKPNEILEKIMQKQEQKKPKEEKEEQIVDSTDFSQKKVKNHNKKKKR